MENHELRLKINAAAAKSGAREFTRAIAAIQAAVRNLERDSSGVFERLKKNAREAGAASNIKIKGIDRGSLKNLENYARNLRGATQAAQASRRSIASATTALRAATDAYSSARSSIDMLNRSLLTTNTALSRQIQLASQARSAVRQVRGAPTPGGGGGGVGGAQGGLSRNTATANRETEKQIALQNRAQRILDNTRLSVERLSTQLAKFGAGSSIRDVIGAYEQLQKSIGRNVTSTSQIDSATTRFNAVLKRAQTSLTTLAAKAKEEAAAIKNAEQALRAQAKALQDAAKAANSLATAKERMARLDEKSAGLQLRSAAAMRAAEQEAARLTARLRGIGDIRGVHDVNAALMRLRSTLSQGVGSAFELRRAMSAFADSTNKAKVGIIQTSSAQQQATRNARNMARAEMDATRQARLMEREIRSVAAASNAASRSFRNATGNLRGLENAFSVSFQAGSAFRALLGSITIGTFTRSVFNAGDALDQFRVTMDVASDTAEQAASNFQFVEDLARNMGTGLRGTRAEFAKFAVASDIAGVSADTTQRIFGSVAKSLTVLGRGTEDQRLAFLALEQMMSKGTISSEELRRQLGERLPGAVNLMAEAAGVTTAELQKMLKAGEVISAEVLPKFADVLERRFGPSLEKAMARAGTQFRIFGTEIEKALENVAQQGFLQTLAGEFRDLNTQLRGSEFQKAARNLGKALADAAEIAGDAAQFIISNIEEIGQVAKAVFVGIVARQLVLVTQSFTIMAQNVIAAVSAFVGIQGAATGSAAAMATNSVAAKQLSASILALGSIRANAARATAMHTTFLDTNTTAAIRNSVAMKKQSTEVVGLAGRLGKTGTALAGFSRIIGGLAGPVGLAITAITALPLLLDDTADSLENVEDASEAYRQAMLDMGTATFNFLDRAREASKAAPFDQLLVNVQALSEARKQLAAFRADEFLGTEVEKALTDLSDIEVTIGGKEAVEEIAGLVRELKSGHTEGARLVKTVDDLKDAIKAAVEGGAVSEQAFSILRRIEELVIEGARAVKTIEAIDAQIFKLGGNAARELATARESAEDFRMELNAAFDVIGSAQERFANIGSLGGAITNTDFSNQINQIFADFNDSSKTAEERIVGLREALNSLESPSSLPQTQRAFESTRQSLIRYIDDTLALAEDTDAAEKALADLRSRLSQTAGEMDGTANSAQRLATAFQNVAQIADSIRKVGTSGLLAELNEEIEVAKIKDEDKRAVAEFFASFGEGGKVLEPITRDIQALRASLSDLSGADPQEVGRLKADIAALEARRDGLQDELKSRFLLKRELEEANKPASGRKAERDIERQKDALQKLFEESQTTAGALNELKEVQKLLAGEVAQATLSIEEQNTLFNEAQKRAVMQIAENEGLASSFRTLGSLLESSSTQMEALQQVRSAEVALIRETGQGLDAETRARLANAIAIDLQKEKQNEAIESLREFVTSSREQIEVLEAVNSGFFFNQNVAEQVIALRRAGIQVNDEFIDSLNRIALAQDRVAASAANPAKEWLRSVPSFKEAANEIEASVFENLSSSIKEFAKTGKFSFDDLITNIHNAAIDIIADGAVKELINLLGGGGPDGNQGFGFGDMITKALGGSIADPRAPDTEGATAALDQGALKLNQQIMAALDQGGNSLNQLLTQANDMGAQSLEMGIVQGAQQGGQIIANAMAGAASNFGGGGAPVGGGGGAPMFSPIPPARPGGGTGGGTGPLGSAAQQLSQGVQQGAQAGAQAITSSMQQGSSSIGETLTNVFASGQEGFQGIFSGLGSLLGGAGGLIGGKAGGILQTVGGIASFLMPMLGFKAGGISDSPTSVNTGFFGHPAMFKNAPSFKDGTANTNGGIPAILHDNEAVIPLTAGRKVPVEMEGMDKVGNRVVKIEQNFNFPNSDADSFRRSRGQVAAEAALTARQALGKQA